MNDETRTFKRLALGFLILATVAIGGVSYLSQQLFATNATLVGLYDTVENCATGKPLRIGTEVFRCVNATILGSQ